MEMVILLLGMNCIKVAERTGRRDTRVITLIYAAIYLQEGVLLLRYRLLHRRLFAFLCFSGLSITPGSLS